MGPQPLLNSSPYSTREQTLHTGVYNMRKPTSLLLPGEPHKKEIKHARRLSVRITEPGKDPQTVHDGYCCHCACSHHYGPGTDSAASNASDRIAADKPAFTGAQGQRS